MSMKGEKRFNFSPWTELPSTEDSSGEKGSEGLPRVMVPERLVALLGLIVISPLMIAIALAIKITSPGGPVLYRQERVGVDRRRSGDLPGHGDSGGDRRKMRGYGKVFWVYKFRSMIPDAEKKTGPVWALDRDPRITGIGRILRKLRLDELPQLFNVIRGEMRLIGPRPERPHFVEKLVTDIPEYPQRQKIPPGITGLAQVEREYDASVDDVRKKVKYDIFYVKHRSGLMNLKILLKTIVVAIRGRGAR
jgi:lipopolysaccharide/colanic/teichoic acid biosynthesis glycosyltransferase